MKREAMTVATVLPGRRRDGEPGHVEVRACRQGPYMFVSTSEVEVKERGPPSLVVQRRRQHRTRETVTLLALRRRLFYAADLRHVGLLGDVGTKRFRATLRIRRRRRFPNHLQRRVGRYGRPGHISRFVNICDETADMNVFIVAARRSVGQPRSLGHVAPTRIIGRALRETSRDRFASAVTKRAGILAPSLVITMGGHYLERAAARAGGGRQR